MSNVQRIQQPQVVRAGTPAGPKATAKPQPTPGTPLAASNAPNAGMTYPTGDPSFSEAKPGRQGHKSTDEQLAQDIWAQHASYFSDQEQAAKQIGTPGVVAPPTQDMVRRAQQHAAQGCQTCVGFLAGLARGTAGGLRIAEQQAKQRTSQAVVTQNSRQTAAPQTPVAPRGVTSHVPPMAQPSNPSAERTRDTVVVRLQQLRAEERASQALFPRVEQAIRGQHQ